VNDSNVGGLPYGIVRATGQAGVRLVEDCAGSAWGKRRGAKQGLLMALAHCCDIPSPSLVDESLVVLDSQLLDA
jgi:hypothetical protein